MSDTAVDEQLWQDFHTVVNMTSRELQEWLATQGAAEETEEVPDRAGPALGHQVLEILGKRRADLTSSDIEVMETVVERVASQRREDLEPTAGGDDWRRGLMNIGHDPLKPVE